MEPKKHGSAGRVSVAASLVLVAGAVLVAVVASGAANARSLAKPASTSEPAISGNAAIGQTLTGTRGTWTDNPTSYDYQWVRCDSGGGTPNGSNCPVVSSGTTAYIVASGDAGSRLRFRVRATNDDGTSDWVASNPTALVSAAPVNTSDPVVSGSTVAGQTLKTTSGGWSSTGTITSFAYQWVRCGTDGGNASGSNCASISGATGSSHKLATADVGHRMRVRVTATNGAGNATAASNPTGVVQAGAASGPPKSTSQPTVSGTSSQGQTLTAGVGTWSGTSPITYAYQWVRCGTDGGRPDGSNCASIGGATTTKYVLTSDDVGKRLRVRVTARNSQGSAVAASNATTTVQASGPELPAGALKLSNGKYSVPATSVALPVRLVIDGVHFAPSPVRSRRTTIELRVHVSGTRGYSVRDVLVFARSTPLVTSAGEQRTGQDGWATIRLAPQGDFPLRRGYSVQFFVRARKDGDNILAGISTRRLVQVRTAR
jgi:hypothetical protein